MIVTVPSRKLVSSGRAISTLCSGTCFSHRRGFRLPLCKAVTRTLSLGKGAEQGDTRQQAVLESGLYVVSTPIGNLQDITLRALDVLRRVVCVYAEDTRRTQKLFNALVIRTPLLSCHAHNERERAKQIVQKIELGEAVAIVSDAGTPLISDPGARVIDLVIQAGLRVIPVPGPSAVLAALVGSGLRTDAFVFLGFLPSKKSDRLERLEQFEDTPATLVLYVAPSDFQSTLQSCVEVLGGSRRCCVAKELTKLHESFVRGSIGECLNCHDIEIRGEITLLIEGAKISETEVSKDVIEACLRSQFAASNISLSDAAKAISVELGVKKRYVYQLALRLKERADPSGHSLDRSMERDT